MNDEEYFWRLGELNWGAIFLLVIAVLYLGAAIFYFVEGKPVMAMVVLCYAIANLGLAVIGR